MAFRSEMSVIPHISDCNLQNQTAISKIRLKSHNQIASAHCFRLQSPHSDCNLHNWTLISKIRLKSPYSDCNLHNQTAISTILLRSPQSMVRFKHVFPIGVHIPECGKRLANCFISISRIRLQSPHSDCNLHNQTTISTINDYISKYQNITTP